MAFELIECSSAWPSLARLLFRWTHVNTTLVVLAADRHAGICFATVCRAGFSSKSGLSPHKVARGTAMDVFRTASAWALTAAMPLTNAFAQSSDPLLIPPAPAKEAAENGEDAEEVASPTNNSVGPERDGRLGPILLPPSLPAEPFSTEGVGPVPPPEPTESADESAPDLDTSATGSPPAAEGSRDIIPEGPSELADDATQQSRPAGGSHFRRTVPDAPRPAALPGWTPQRKILIDDAVRAATEGLAIDEETRSRYRLWEGEWWFQTRSGGWKYYRDGTWRDFDPRNYSSPDAPPTHAFENDGLLRGSRSPQPHVTFRPVGSERYGSAGTYEYTPPEVTDALGRPAPDYRFVPADGVAPYERPYAIDGLWPPHPDQLEPPPDERRRPRPLRNLLNGIFNRR